ncbi:hypothetical protein MACK_003951 [Theileria orientalis]|uniref:Uncharacterized protein n=1 Tax=Theileria orientalis TaxID=68886 RepID=A0A976XJH3_THEOR|nr:hypothetical protein MACK_003951 [Theileria orientalis]
MVFFSKKNGIYSSKLTLHVYSIALQCMMGVRMILCSPNLGDLSLVFKVRSIQDVYELGFDLLQYGGIAHIGLALITMVGVFLTYFFVSLFKIPMIVISMIQGSFCSTTALVCVYLLQKGYSSVNNMVNYLETTGSYLGFDLSKTNMLIDKRKELFFIGILAAMASSMYSRAQCVSGDDSCPETMINAPSLSLGLAISFALIAPCRDYRIVALGFLWLLACIVGEVITTVGSFKLLKFVNYALVVVHCSMFVFSIVTIIHCVGIYTHGRLDYTSYITMLKGGVVNYVSEKAEVTEGINKYVNTDLIKGYFLNLTTEHTDERINFYMENGSFLLVIILLCTVNTIFTMIATLYMVFKFFDIFSSDNSGKKSKGKGSKDDRSFVVVIDQKS